MSERLQTVTQAMRLPAWESLPDFGLYMDQLVTYVQRCYAPLEDEESVNLTPAMINNYVKSGLIGRPQGKKYPRECLAQLLMICRLKPTTSLQTMQTLLRPAEGQDIAAVYRGFCEAQARIAAQLAGAGETDPLFCAIEAAGWQLLCRKMGE